MSPETISKIADGHVDDSWIKVLSDLDRRVAAYHKSSSNGRSKASEDLGPLLEKLTQKVLLLS